MMQTNIQFWEDHWQSALAASPQRKHSRLKRWNKMAADFARRTNEERASEKRRKTIQWLQDEGALRPDARILDIGAGPGNWSIALARSAAQVVALEPAEGMVEILQKRLAEEAIDNVRIDQRTWQSVDLAEEGWEGAFDLVFASMTPGIDGPANLRKLIAASRGACYLSAFSGRSWHHWYQEVWQTVLGEPLKAGGHDIIHPFNLVYAMGYRPQLRFSFWERERTLTREKAVEEICLRLEAFTEVTAEVTAKVAAYVDQHCRNGGFHQHQSACQGMMLWQVQKNVHSM
jgi:SAM-dependent methyltransferase